MEHLVPTFAGNSQITRDILYQKLHLMLHFINANENKNTNVTLQEVSGPLEVVWCVRTNIGGVSDMSLGC